MAKEAIIAALGELDNDTPASIPSLFLGQPLDASSCDDRPNAGDQCSEILTLPVSDS
jgi:hypothetical protein